MYVILVPKRFPGGDGIETSLPLLQQQLLHTYLYIYTYVFVYVKIQISISKSTPINCNGF